MTKEELAERCPITTAFARQMREVFGDGVKMTWLSENGVELGKRDAKLERKEGK